MRFPTSTLRGLALVLALAVTGVAAQAQPRSKPAAGGRDSVGLVPLTELGRGEYQGYLGGLYGEGKNEPPAAHLAAARKASATVRPLDGSGKPADDGKIVLLALGMSNTSQAFGGFERVAAREKAMSSRVALVNAGLGGVDAAKWVDPAGRTPAGVAPWDEVDTRLAKASVTAAQVQVVWVKPAHLNPAQYGAFPAHARRLQDDVAKLLQAARARFPNLRLAYVSSRTYGGYAKGNGNPEPYAYESGFAVQGLIRAQIQGDPALCADATRGAVRAPLVLWGPYLWADGTTPRRADGLTWLRADVAEKDGVHESEAGQRKAGELLCAFFKGDTTTRTWFLGEAGAAHR